MIRLFTLFAGQVYSFTRSHSSSGFGIFGTSSLASFFWTIYTSWFVLGFLLLNISSIAYCIWWVVLIPIARTTFFCWWSPQLRASIYVEDLVSILICIGVSVIFGRRFSTSLLVILVSSSLIIVIKSYSVYLSFAPSSSSLTSITLRFCVIILISIWLTKIVECDGVNLLIYLESIYSFMKINCSFPKNLLD